MNLYTIERPWSDNAPFVSCVPAGIYFCSKHVSPKFGETFILENHALDVGKAAGEALRSHILIHAANRSAELRGCIAPGMDLGVVNGEWAILSSRQALSRLKFVVGNHASFLLNITWKQHHWSS